MVGNVQISFPEFEEAETPATQAVTAPLPASTTPPPLPAMAVRIEEMAIFVFRFAKFRQIIKQASFFSDPARKLVASSG